MESNQSLYLKKGIQFSVFGAHSSGLICNPVCSGPDLLTPCLYSPLDWGTTYISLERHKMSLEMISGFETSVSVDFNWTQVFVFDVCGHVLCLGLWVCVRVLYSCIYIIMLTAIGLSREPLLTYCACMCTFLWLADTFEVFVHVQWYLLFSMTVFKFKWVWVLTSLNWLLLRFATNFEIFLLP